MAKLLKYIFFLAKLLKYALCNEPENEIICKALICLV